MFRDVQEVKHIYFYQSVVSETSQFECVIDKEWEQQNQDQKK